MRIVNLIGYCATLTIVSAQLYGDEKAMSRVDAGGARVFNVLNYGAVGDDKTDNTTAFSACLKAVIEAGGGRMYLPAGIYRGRIIIPAVEPTRWIACGQKTGARLKSNNDRCFAGRPPGKSRPSGNTVQRIRAGWAIPIAVDGLAGAEQG